jgi:TolB-like protein/Tfp pilus assembly protein PilF
MSSLIPGYEYDIFISYRQKDNKYDGWVTEFVDNLKKELEATFKEEISVYFDINPHDGLLETHDVDESLKEKLKCLVFIPIISRTYCDPKSFAWEHEFKTFVEQASQDKFGLKIKLPNGNVANRVLPIRIHDLDVDDIKLCESVLGGVLRGIEFIYKEPGVNKPLTADDDEKKNLNNTKYRIQINKTANAIKEIIQGLLAEPAKAVEDRIQPKESVKEVKEKEKRIIKGKSAKAGSFKFLITIAIVALIIIAGIIAYPKIFKRDTLERLRAYGERISVAVMPFQNMTNDTTWNIWQDGIKDELINYLTNSEELRVIQTESINHLIQSKGLTNYASITPSVASGISKRLDANVSITGSIKQAGDKIRVNAQIIDSKTEESLKSFQIEGQSTEENIFPIIDSLSRMVKNFIIISTLGKGVLSIFHTSQPYFSTNSPKAYRYLTYANNAVTKGDWATAGDWLLNAAAIDSNFAFVTIQLYYAYMHQNLWAKAREWCLKAYKKRKQMPDVLKFMADRTYSHCFETPNEEIKHWRQLLEIDKQTPHYYTELGYCYSELQQYDKAIPEYEKALEIYKKWGSKPFWASAYTRLGEAYHKTGQYKKEKRVYKMAAKDFPNNESPSYRQAILSLAEGDTDEANRYIEKYISIRKKNSASRATIATGLAGIYSQANILDKAEEYYRQALSLEPKSRDRINTLAYFLIDNDRNINEGMELVENALNNQSDNFSYLDTKGWGLYKQGKYQEALDVLQKSWNLKSRYNHQLYLHLEAAKKAVAGQKNN